MTDIHLSQILQSLVYIQYDFGELMLRKRSILFDPILKIAFIADFRNYIAISLRLQGLNKLEYVRMIHLLQNAYLLKYKFLQSFRLESIK